MRYRHCRMQRELLHTVTISAAGGGGAFFTASEQLRRKKNR
jgi:hypothetical protein